MNVSDENVINLSNENDTRVLCKYGKDCYQKNPKHHEKYKHPPDTQEQIEQVSKKRKLDRKEVPISKEQKLMDNQSTIETKDQQSSENEQEKENVTDETEHETECKINTDLNEKDFIKEYFLFNMPRDFYSFWNFCKSLNNEDPLNALESVDLMLVGVFDVLANKFTNIQIKDEALFLRHWRYYFDPPEMQTVIKCHDKIGLHFGYYRDDPKEEPVFVCSGTLNDGRLHVMAENLFGCVNAYFENFIKKRCTPFNKMKIIKLRTQLQEWAKKEQFTLEEKTDSMKKRDSKVVTRTFHGVGIVVPYNKKTQLGYRPLIETNDNIKKILKNIVDSKEKDVRDSFFSKLQPIITMASIAADECDFGTSLELGLDLFAYGGEVLHNAILSLLVSAYNLLGRDIFATIIKAHLKDRKKSSNLTILYSNL